MLTWLPAAICLWFALDLAVVLTLRGRLGTRRDQSRTIITASEWRAGAR
jgi:hypothetical protein